MEDSAAAEVEAEEQLDILGYYSNVNPSYDSFRSGAGKPARAQEDDGPSAASEALAAPRKQPYRHKSHETSPLLTKVEDMSGQLSSPIEIAGIEGVDGAKRPWLRAKIQQKKPWWETPSVVWLLPPFLLYCLAMGAVSVPKLNVILNIICRQYHYMKSENDRAPLSSLSSNIGQDNEQCQNSEVHALLGQFMLCANLISGTLCAFSSPRLGALSDRYGRRMILAVTALGMLLGDIITITVASFPDSISVWMILTEFALGGLAGSFIATMAVIQSYAADCTPPARRSIVFGYLHGCMFTGIAVGPILGGLIIKASGNILTIFYVAFVCHLGFITFVSTVVPESLSEERRDVAREAYKADARNLTAMGTILGVVNIFRPLSILFPPKDRSSKIVRTNLILLSAVDTVVFGVTLGSASLVVMYSEFMFKWGNFDSSVFVSIANSCRVGMLILILPLVSRIFNARKGHTQSGRSGSDTFDILTIRTAVFFDVLGYIGYALAPSGPFFIASGVIASVGGIASPTLQSALTTHVVPERTGELLGAISLLHALSRIAVPALLHLVYILTIGTASASVFWCLTATFGLALAGSFWIRPRTREHEYTRV